VFSRQPDYFESERVPSTVEVINGKYTVRYGAGSSRYWLQVDYPFRHLAAGQRVVVIYDPLNPNNGALYRVWGYWLKLGELLFSFGLIIVLSMAAVFITGKNLPPPNLPYEKRRKYNL